MNDTSNGRRIMVDATGDTANEIELAALDEARQVFGEDVKLAVDRDYGVTPNGNGNGKKYRATVWISESL